MAFLSRRDEDHHDNKRSPQLLSQHWSRDALDDRGPGLLRGGGLDASDERGPGLLRGGGEDLRARGYTNSDDEDVEVELTLDMEMSNIASKDMDFQDALIDFKDAVACDVAHAVSGRRDKVHVLGIHAGNE